MPRHRTRVGLGARNAARFPEPDYALVRDARIETLKMMSYTDEGVFRRLRQENPDLEFIVRLYDDRFGRDSRPSAAAFVARMVPILDSLRPYAEKFEIHNEPNHVEGLEGWGAGDQDAQNFGSWYIQVLAALREHCPWARFGFPGLAMPDAHHRDLAWLDICRDAIEASDWLGSHCYWQYGNMLSENWGLRFKLYHRRFPNIQIEVTEFANSTPPQDLPREEMARQYAEYYKELNKYPYVNSACSFIASSPDPAWVAYVWMKEGGERAPVVAAIRDMDRTPIEIVPEPEPAPAPEPPPAPAERTFPQTGKTARGIFLQFFEQYGLDLCGYPITDQFEENGLPTQYFQRLALEEFKPGKIRLKLVGTDAWMLRKKVAELEEQIRGLGGQTPQPGTDTAPGKTTIPAPDIQDLIEELPRHATKTYNSRDLSQIENLIIHHSAVVATVGPQRIAEYHVKNEDWPGIGYHFLVADDGTLYQGNALDTVSFHAAGVNTKSVGICFLGNFQKEVPPQSQVEAGARLVAWLMQKLHLDLEAVKGHQEFMQTACPGAQWLKGKQWKQMLRQQIIRVQEEATPEPEPEPEPSKAKAIYHYMLFWSRNAAWAEKDWLNALNYVGRFQPTIGFRVNDAAQAEYVTIVGGPLGVPKSAEEWLEEQGCKVDRIAGKDEADTKRILDELVDQGKRFLAFDE